ncbi:MAG: arginine--tRNA ligase [Candidatus Paceibacterota bacterium]
MIKAEISKFVGEAVKKLFTCETPFEILVPENENFGHYSTNAALKLAKNFKQNPMEIAESIKYQVLSINKDFFEKIEVVAPGFINFWISPKILQENIKEILSKKEKFGKGKKKNKTIIIEYSSPNIAKPLGIHHLRSTVIGQAINDILKADGYKTISLSFPGDWGTQFGLLIAGYKRWGSKEKIKKDPISELLNLYIRFSAAAKENPELLNEGRNEFKRLEDGDKENLKLWKWFSKESMKGFEKIYKVLGVKIENVIPESFYEPELKKLVREIVDRKIAKIGEDGSVVIPIPGSETPEIIQKSDGATIYTTRDLAAIRHRFKKWKADKILYVVANDQTFHFSQVFKCAEILGFAKPGQLEHVKFGMMLGEGGKKFATREGKLIKLEDVLNEAVKRSEEIVKKLNPKISATEKKKISEIVGIGAVKFFDLSQNRTSDIIFDWDKMLNLKGSSAPYIQYAYARFKNVLKKSKTKIDKKAKFSLLGTKTEMDLIFHLSRFGEAVEDAAKTYEPNKIADYLLKLAEKANAFYETSPVLKSEKPLMEARLALIEATTLVIKKGLNLLGINVLEKM